MQTKDELNKTWLTNATVGYGNNQKKDFEGQVNYFSKDGDNLSFIAQSTNRYQNSTYKDNINNSVGMNMTHKFGKKFSLTGSVNYNLNRQVINTLRLLTKVTLRGGRLVLTSWEAGK